MSQEAEPSIYEYAVFHGLVQDHKAIAPLELIPPPNEHNYPLALEDLHQGCKHSATSQENGVEIDSTRCTACLAEATNAFQVSVQNERMFVDAGTASVLASISHPASAPQSFHEYLDLDPKRYQRLKHDLPLLSTDHDCDMQEFTQPFTPNLEDEFLPFEAIDEGADDGLTWPLRDLSERPELLQNILTEKLELSAEALRLLVEVTNYDASTKVFEAEGYTYKGTTLPRPSTPPLLPMSPRSIPFVPSSEVGYVTLVSEPSSPTKEELCKMELDIFAKDAIKPMAKASASSPQSSDPMLLDSDNLGDIYSPLKGIEDPPSSPPDERLRPQNLKVEIPMSPMDSEKCPPWERESFSLNGTLTQLIPDLPESLPDPEGEVSLDEIDKLFSETIKPIAVDAERRVVQEQLLEADTISRVAVPMMDFTLPTPPWQNLGTRSDNDSASGRRQPSLLGMEALHLQDHVWPLSGDFEHKLRWTPFSAALVKTELEETIRDDDESLTMFLAQPAPLDTQTLIWKPEGLRLLDDVKGFGADELHEGSFPDEDSFDCLIRKRRLDLQADEAVSSALDPAPARSARSLASLKGATAPGLATLEDFIETRTGEVRAKAKPELVDRATKAAKPTQMSSVDPCEPQPYTVHGRTSFQSSVSPFIVSMPQDCRVFIASATLFKDRRLARQIQKRYTGAELIERDFSLHGVPEKGLPTANPNCSKGMLDTLEDEVDLILSPSTGLLWTTLGKVRQRSLPGQTAHSAIRERLRRTAPRYETLIIIIAEDCRPSEDDRSHLSSEFNNSDAEAIADFTVFCSGLEDATMVLFSSGGVEELSNWIVALMVKYSVPHAGTELIHEETLWEIFLRKAGMNAFAAQVILRELDQENMDHRTGSDFGLTAFVKMSEDERFARFEGLLGGRKLLSRMTQVFESRW